MFPDRFVSRTRRRAAEVRLAAAVQGRNPRALAAGLVVIGYLVLIAAPLASDILASGLPGPGMPGGPATRPRAASSAAPPAAAGGAAQPSGVPAVDQYLRGVSDLDAGLMWGALAAGEIKTREARGGSLEALQRELDEVKQRGIRYERADLVAAYPLRSGETYLFYALSRRGFAGPERLDRVSLVFTIDGSGKIADVSWNRPEDLRPSASR